MKYERIIDEEREEITKEKALDILLGSYRDNDMTRDMLEIPNRIQCMFSTIEVKSDDGMILMAGLYNMLPNNYLYDDAGNRVK